MAMHICQYFLLGLLCTSLILASEGPTPSVNPIECLGHGTCLHLDCYERCRLQGFVTGYVTVSLEGPIPISFGGTEEAAAYGEFVAIGILNQELNKKLSAEIALVLHTLLAVPKSRFFLKFNDIEGYNCGLNGGIMVVESK
ncbi:phenylpyruvate tautomerase [Trifolium repens]|nr:phenylpyruvate tautomerase [Trifolium repens]